MSVKYSFIIPIYNEQNDLQDTVDSCLKQEFPTDKYEVILIDDGSSDNSYALCKQQYHQIDSIKILHYHVNKGVSYARNYGVKSSNGEVLVFLNADEIVPCDFLKKLDKHYDKGADYVYPQTRVLNRKNIYGLYRDCYRQYKYNMPNKFLWSQGFSCKKDIFWAVDGFNEKYPGCGGEDWDFTTKIEKLAVNRVVDLSIVVKHKVPEKIEDIVWHMYNRGRGSAYFDLIGKMKNPKYYLVKALFHNLFIIGVLIYEPLASVMYFVNKMYVFLNNTYKICKCNGLKKGYIKILSMSVLDTILREISYSKTMFDNLVKRK